MIAIQGTYSKITTALAVPNLYNIYPFDLYGNLLTEMTIEVNSTLGSPTIQLPVIATLNNNWNLKINLIALNGTTFAVGIVVGGTFIGSPVDQIGSLNSVVLSRNNANVEISPIGLINWAANITA